MTVRTDTRLPLFETITPPYPTPHFSNTTEDLLFPQHGARQCNLANNCCSTGYLTFFSNSHFVSQLRYIFWSWLSQQTLLLTVVRFPS